MPQNILTIALPIPGVSDDGEATSSLARTLRAADRSLDSGSLVQFPWLDGSRGTLDFLVTNTLGSFLEVEATGSSGDEVVVPIGFAGEDGKLAVIEMSRVASVAATGGHGTTAGIGELIQDALDEGAFSIVLCHEEPLAFDAGFGAAAALGVRFIDVNGAALDLSKPGSSLAYVERIDLSSRSFALLSSRIFIATSHSAKNSEASVEQKKELKRLAKILRRDTGIPVELQDPSASAVELGLCALLGAEVRDGLELVIEASRIPEAMERGDFSAAIILAPSEAELRTEPFASFLDRLRAHIPHRAILVRSALVPDGAMRGKDHSASEVVHSLAELPIFQAPLRANATREELARDLMMRLEKIMPRVLDDLKQAAAAPKRARHA